MTPSGPGLTYSFREGSLVSALSRSLVLREGGTGASSPLSGGPSRAVRPATPAGRVVLTFPPTSHCSESPPGGGGDDQGQGPEPSRAEAVPAPMEAPSLSLQTPLAPGPAQPPTSPGPGTHGSSGPRFPAQSAMVMEGAQCEGGRGREMWLGQQVAPSSPAPSSGASAAPAASVHPSAVVQRSWNQPVSAPCPPPGAW